MRKSKLIIAGLIMTLVLALVPTATLSSKTDSSGSEKVVTLTDRNVIVLNTQVDSESVAKVITEARKLDSTLLHRNEPIYLFMNTPGGSIQSGLELLEALKGLHRPVHTITLFAASMGFQLVQGLGDRLVLKNGVMMSHHASGQISGDFGGVSTQLDSRYKLWKDRIRELDEQTVKRTRGKQTYKSYTKEYDHEVWLTGTESVAEGYSDNIARVRCDSSLDGVNTQSVQIFGFTIQYDLDKCPLNTSPMNIRLANAQTVPLEMANEAKARFLEQFEQKQRQALPMTW
jgi:ATP-dependent Clp protease protease subunit